MLTLGMAFMLVGWLGTCLENWLGYALTIIMALGVVITTASIIHRAISFAALT